MHTAIEPQRPPVGTYWGSTNYVVTGYWLASCDGHGVPQSYGTWYQRHEDACAAANDGESVLMVTRMVNPTRG